LKTYTRLQERLWKIANFDTFLMKFCPTLFNKIASVGLLYVFQLILILLTLFATSYAFFEQFWFIGGLLSPIITYQSYKLIIKSNRKFQGNPTIEGLIFRILILLFVAFISTLPICLLLFEQQIIYQLYLDFGGLEFSLWEIFWYKSEALYNFILTNSEGSIVLYFGLSVFILQFFIFIAPYILIFYFRNTLYYTIKRHYEHNFFR